MRKVGIPHLTLSQNLKQVLKWNTYRHLLNNLISLLVRYIIPLISIVLVIVNHKIAWLICPSQNTSYRNRISNHFIVYARIYNYLYGYDFYVTWRLRARSSVIAFSRIQHLLLYVEFVPHTWLEVAINSCCHKSGMTSDWESTPQVPGIPKHTTRAVTRFLCILN